MTITTPNIINDTASFPAGLDFRNPKLYAEYDDTATSTSPTDTTIVPMPQISLQRWAKIVDDSARFFIQYHRIENDLRTLLEVVGFVFGSSCKAKIFLEPEPNGYGRDYLVISISVNKKREEKLVDYLIQCNRGLARLLPLASIPLLVLTTE